MKLSKYEKDILEAYKKGEFVSVSNLNKEKTKLVKAARNTLKDKSISIRMNSFELARFKTRATELGIPYQTLIASLIKRFNDGRIKSI